MDDAVDRAEAGMHRGQCVAQLSGIGHIGGNGQHFGTGSFEFDELLQPAAQRWRLVGRFGDACPFGAFGHGRAAQQHQPGLPCLAEVARERKAHAAEPAGDQVHAALAQPLRAGHVGRKRLVAPGPTVRAAVGDDGIVVQGRRLIGHAAREVALGRAFGRRQHHVDDAAGHRRRLLAQHLGKATQRGLLG
ncbi:hypothetical protein FQZ97_933070 [compost metagenome]